ncbi:MAG: hypothetical protein K0V04_38730 [Deltaproteobacteria bacterium]|nr:hypothetical protein [Deltaproteobacteria bacterium]
MSTTSARTRIGSSARVGVVLGVAMAMLGTAVPAQASPWSVPSRAALRTIEAPAEPATVDAAVEAGDLSSARTLATQAREAEPTAATWQREGEVLEQSGEYRDAAKSYRQAKKAAGEDADALAAAEAGLSRVGEASRGIVDDEPESTHREQLDEVWDPPPPPRKADPTPPVEPVDAPPRERIVKKWYFWVTVGAIAASAAAVTAIAIRAARDDQPDALDSLSRRPASRGLGVLRF